MTLDPRPARWRAAGTELDVTSSLDPASYVSHTIADAILLAAEQGKSTLLTRNGTVIAEIVPAHRRGT